MKQWYEQLFENYANKYENEVFTKGTEQEVAFLEMEAKMISAKKILDIGCGTGRHAIALAKKGFRMTGIDLSQNMLDKAKSKANEAGVDINFLLRDARKFSFKESFDMVIMLCEGGFSLMETDRMNFDILENASKVVKKGGLFIFNCLNALFPLYHSVKDLVNQSPNGEVDGSFDIMTFREFSTYNLHDDDENPLHLSCNERYYAPSEIHFMLELIGFNKIEIYGGGIGEFSRENQLRTDHYQMLIVAEK